MDLKRKNEIEKERNRERQSEGVTGVLEFPDKTDLCMCKDACLVDNLSPPGFHTEKSSTHVDVFHAKPAEGVLILYFACLLRCCVVCVTL